MPRGAAMRKAVVPGGRVIEVDMVLCYHCGGMHKDIAFSADGWIVCKS